TKTTTAPAAKPAEVLRQPSREQRREIVDMLREVYDPEAERYRRNDTDATVADVLGVMPGWPTWWSADSGRDHLGRPEAARVKSVPHSRGRHPI
ncbi:hypothetical protein JMM61_20710, partial [Rhodovulum sulfidophilum]|nr:hypothetical protein [Rhodovulum sulfidophilum]